MFEQLAISRQQLAKSELSTLSVILSGAFAAVANAESKDLTSPFSSHNRQTADPSASLGMTNIKSCGRFLRGC
jgi:hypothetical protein